MNVSDLRERESFDEIVCATLNHHLPILTNQSTRIALETRQRRPSGQTWYQHSRFGAFVTRSASRKIRRFIGDLFRFTDNRIKHGPQAAAVTLMSSRAGFLFLNQPAFQIIPELPHEHDLAFLPGNQRIRLIDVSRRTVRVMQKSGFDSHTLHREVAVRTTEQGPFLPLSDHDVGAGWFEEPFVDGWALARCPPWRDRNAEASDAMAQLTRWSEPRQRTVATREYLGTLEHRLRDHAVRLSTRFGTSLGGRAVEVAATIGRGVHTDHLTVGPTHGDFQPGNVIVRRDGAAPLIVDWEHVGERFADYDRMTWTLRTRSAWGLAERADEFLDRGPRTNSADRRLTLAVSVLEDLVFFAGESLSGPFRRPSRGLGLMLGELHRLHMKRGAWWRGL